MLRRSEFEDELNTLAERIGEENELTEETVVGSHEWPRKCPLSILFHSRYYPSVREVQQAANRARTFSQVLEQLAETALYQSLRRRVDHSAHDRNG